MQATHPTLPRRSARLAEKRWKAQFSLGTNDHKTFLYSTRHTENIYNRYNTIKAKTTPEHIQLFEKDIPQLFKHIMNNTHVLFQDQQILIKALQMIDGIQGWKAHTIQKILRNNGRFTYTNLTQICKDFLTMCRHLHLSPQYNDYKDKTVKRINKLLTDCTTAPSGVPRAKKITTVYSDLTNNPILLITKSELLTVVNRKFNDYIVDMYDLIKKGNEVVKVQSYIQDMMHFYHPIIHLCVELFPITQ